MAEKQYDLAVLGGGPGGYVAAIRAARLGLRTVLIERDKVGGTCLHHGCIPSKALLKSASFFAACKRADEFGISLESVVVHYDRISARKDKIVAQLHKGVEHLLKKNAVDVFAGSGRIMGPSIFSPTCGTLSLQKADGETQLITPRHVVIATGSRPRPLPLAPFDGHKILSLDDALALTALPARVVIVGDTPWAAEFASMYCDFGTEVTLLVPSSRILPEADEEVSRELQKQLKRRKVQLLFNISEDEVAIDTGSGGVTVHTTVGAEPIMADIVIHAGRRLPNVEEIGLENTDIRIHDGAIVVDPQMRTQEKHLFAVGDVTGATTAHAAIQQGIIAAEAIAEVAPAHHWNADNVPYCVYSRPGAAGVGLSETAARERGIPVKTGKFLLRALGYAQIAGEIDGFVKFVVREDTEDILGVHIVGDTATEMISEAGLMKLLDASPWEAGINIRPHPSFSEGLTEAALDVWGAAIHI